MSRDERLRLGSCVLRLTGDHPVLDLVLDELAPLRLAGSEAPPDVELRVISGDLERPPAGAVELGPVTADGAAAWCRLPRTGFHVHFAPPRASAPVRITAAIAPRPMPFRIPRPLFRWVEPTFLTPVEAQAYVFMLRLVEGAVFLYGGETALLHAACVERSGHAVALTSAGGIGKTSTAAALLARPGWRYLSDDILPVSADGRVTFHPRWPMVYAYNLRNDPELRRRIVGSGGWKGRLQWGALVAAGIERRRRRVAPSTLWGERRIGESGRLDLVAFLSRGSEDRLHVEELGAADLAARSRSIIALEEAVLGEMVRLWEAAGAPPVRWDDALDRHRSIYERVFAGVRGRVHLRLPRAGCPVTAADAIERLAGGADGG